MSWRARSRTQQLTYGQNETAYLWTDVIHHENVIGIENHIGAALNISQNVSVCRIRRIYLIFLFVQEQFFDSAT